MDVGSIAFRLPTAKKLDELSDAERYLLSVREASRAVPNVMTMDRAPSPCPVLLGGARSQGSEALREVPLDAVWVSEALATFVSLRDHIAWWLARAEAGGSLPGASLAAVQQLRGAGARNWRGLCFGEQGGQRQEAAAAQGAGAAAAAATGEDNVWRAEDGNDGEEAVAGAGEDWGDEEWAEDEGGEGEGEEGQGPAASACDGGGIGNDNVWVAPSEEGEEGEGEGGSGGSPSAGGGAVGAGALPQVAQQAPAPLPPLLSYVIGLDQLAIVRALTHSVGAVKARGAGSPLPPSEAAWLYALLAALQVPFVGTTAALLRELYGCMRDKRRALGPTHAPQDLAGASLLCIIAGRFFGQGD
jgi:hypothetical protein